MNKLVEILQLLELSTDIENEKLKTIKIIDEKQRDNQYLFTLNLLEPLPAKLWSKIQQFKYHDIFFNVKIAHVHQVNQHHLQEYLLHIIEQFPHLKLLKKHIELNHCTYDHQQQALYFKYYVNEELDEINQSLKTIVNILTEAFGLIDLKYVLKYDDKLEQSQIAKKVLTAQKLEDVKQQQKIKQSVQKNQVETKIDASKIVNLSELMDGMINTNILGEIYHVEYKEYAKVHSYRFYISDYEATFTLKAAVFKTDNYPNQTQKNVSKEVLDSIVVGDWVLVTGDIKSDKFELEPYCSVKKLVKAKMPSKFVRTDDAEQRRIELTIHSKMSAFDGIAEPLEIVQLAQKLKHEAIAITDRYNIQSFPEFQKAISKTNLKPIYGCEFCVLNFPKAALNTINAKLDNLSYVVFDLETTGLNPVYDDIIEFGGIRYINGQKTEELQFFIKPKKPVTAFTTELTGITDEHLKDAISQQEGIAKILKFIGNDTLIAHNAINFDFRFLCCKAEKYLHYELHNPVIDTLHVARALFPSWKSHRLEKIAKELKVEYSASAAHRADYDAIVLNACWNNLLGHLKTHNIIIMHELNTILPNLNDRIKLNYQSDYTYVYARNTAGLKKLNELVSLAHTKYLYDVPKIPKEFLLQNRQDLILAPSPVDGEIMYLALSGLDKELKNAMNNYDYIFITHINKFLPLIKNLETTQESIESAIIKIVRFACELNKPIVAVGDAYYLNQWDKQYQTVYLHAKALNGRKHRYYRSNYKYKVLPDQYVLSTNDMKAALHFLGDEKMIHEIVVSNTHKFCSEIQEGIKPIKDGLFAPKMENVDKQLETQVYKKAHEIYGDQLPNIVEARLVHELSSIITHQFSVVYWVSHLLVQKSLNDGYPVGSRGSVGSSLVATMLSITDVNPLAPHYICQKCKYCEFVDDIDDGFDLPNKECPKCHDQMYGEGHNIPFETFLGFKGDKVPDIDLNFSGDYQAIAHNFIKEIFGDEYAFRAGTISTVAEKTCFSIVKSYFDEIGHFNVKHSETFLYAKKCQNVKRTTGQHPGGILVIPKEYSIYDFCPYNFPADDKKSDWYTTHYKFEYLHDNLLKFDILGHDNPTILKKLRDLTGIHENDIPHFDNSVINLFTSTNSLKIDDENLLEQKNGAISLPEFGTANVRNMLEETQPQSFADLIRISGLSHGTGVYKRNADLLIKNNNLKLKDVIACRDDIMIYLIKLGVDHANAFNIMEDVRKGKKLKPEYIDLMKAKNVPNWYIESCNKIEYIFPKAHATAYVIHAWKFAWYKIYYPLEYYATFLSTKADIFEIETVIKGRMTIKQKLDDIQSHINAAKNNRGIAVKQTEKDLIIILEVCLEMLSRGFKILKPDIYKSQATEFIIENGNLLAPFNCIPGIGAEIAHNIIAARNEQPFLSFDDIAKRTSLTKTAMAKLNELGVFDSLPQCDQLSLF